MTSVTALWILMLVIYTNVSFLEANAVIEISNPPEPIISVSIDPPEYATSAYTEIETIVDVTFVCTGDVSTSDVSTSDVSTSDVSTSDVSTGDEITLKWDTPPLDPDQYNITDVADSLYMKIYAVVAIIDLPIILRCSCFDKETTAARYAVIYLEEYHHALEISSPSEPISVSIDPPEYGAVTYSVLDITLDVTFVCTGDVSTGDTVTLEWDKPPLKHHQYSIINVNGSSHMKIYAETKIIKLPMTLRCSASYEGTTTSKDAVIYLANSDYVLGMTFKLIKKLFVNSFYMKN